MAGNLQKALVGGFAGFASPWVSRIDGARLAEFCRYFLVSAVALLLDFITLRICVSAHGWDYRWATCAGFLAGTVAAYVLSVVWVFQHRRFRQWVEDFPRFALVGVMGLALNVGLMMALVDGLDLDYRWSKGGAAAVSFLFNYLIRRLWLFSRSGGMS